MSVRIRLSSAAALLVAAAASIATSSEQPEFGWTAFEATAPQEGGHGVSEWHQAVRIGIDEAALASVTSTILRLEGTVTDTESEIWVTLAGNGVLEDLTLTNPPVGSTFALQANGALDECEINGGVCWTVIDLSCWGPGVAFFDFVLELSAVGDEAGASHQVYVEYL